MTKDIPPTQAPAADDRAAKKAARKSARRRRSSGEDGGFVVLLIVLIIGLGAVNTAMAGVVFIGIIPSLVMSVTDRHAMSGMRVHAVTFINIAGVVPFAKRVYEQPSSWEAVLLDPITMVVMWGAATIGYMLLYLGPMVASILLQSFNQDKLKSLAQQRQELIDLWGPEVMAEQNKPAPAEEPQSGSRQKLIQPKS